MLRTDGMWRNGGRLLSLALLGGLAINATPVDAAPASTAAVQSWISLSASGQLCRTWSAASSATHELALSVPTLDGANTSVNTLSFDALSQRAQTDTAKGLATSASTAATANTLTAFTVTGATSVATSHCTTAWHISNDGMLISDAPDWVPNPTGAWPVASDADTNSFMLSSISLRESQPQTQVNLTLSRAVAVHHIVSRSNGGSSPHSNPGPNPNPGYGPPPGGIGPWVPVPGHPSYGMSDFAGDPHAAEFGVCTWYAWYMRRNEPQLGNLGMADQWLANARARGMRTGYTPAVGATVVFAPGVQGAGGSGHVGHVEAILGNGWFVISEMNFTWNGGGWGRVDFRYVHVGSGVAFIY